MSRALGHGVYLKSMSRTITMQGFLILAIIGTDNIRRKMLMDGWTNGCTDTCMEG